MSKVLLPYDRAAAVGYAYRYAKNPNVPQWMNYEEYGGNCTNFISQCLYAGGMPFDTKGRSEIEKWYWYSDKERTPSWTAATAFKNYLFISQEVKQGIQMRLGTKEELRIGDVVQLGDLKETRHSMLVVGFVRSDEPPFEVMDWLIAQNSVTKLGRMYGIPLSTKPEDRLYYLIDGYLKDE
ncbi:MAG: amidase domain-containing protein [Cellulosilyticaceae bacterium]